MQQIETFLKTQSQQLKNNYFQYNANNTKVAVIIEPRKHKWLENVVRNVMYNLSNEWNLHMFTYDINYVKEMFPNCTFKTTKLDSDNLSPTEYNSLIKSLNFWNEIDGENVLIFQTDSIIMNKMENLDEFLQYSFIGGTYHYITTESLIKQYPGKIHGYDNNPSHINLTIQIHLTNSPLKHYSINGGLSLRKKSSMIECIRKITEDDVVNYRKKYYMNPLCFFKPNIGEDLYFQHALEILGYDRAITLDICQKFCENLAGDTFHKDSFGLHNIKSVYVNHFSTEINNKFMITNAANVHNNHIITPLLCDDYLDTLRPIIMQLQLAELFMSKNESINTIKFYKILEQNKIKDIETVISFPISNIIVQKIYTHKNADIVANYYGGIERQFEFEVKILIMLKNFDHFPKLLLKHTDNNCKCIYTTFCGESVQSNNIPCNWKEQLHKIITSLETNNIFNNDINPDNFLIHNGKIFLIDFGSASIDQPRYPFMNISHEDIEAFDNFEKLLNFVVMRVYRDRLETIKNIIQYHYTREDYALINGIRPPETHTIIIWDAAKDMDKAKQYIKSLPVNSLKVLYEQAYTLTKDDDKTLMKCIYHTDTYTKIVNNYIYLIVIEDTNPIYSFEKTTSCYQLLNTNMKTLKEDMREKIGGSTTNHNCVHTSYNTEEALMVLQPFVLTKFIRRPSFTSFKTFFECINNVPKLKYIVQRSFDDLERKPTSDFFKIHKKDVDILVNDYYYFKAITGARSVHKTIMRENDNGYNIQSTIDIGGVEITFDIRFLGDNYVDGQWEIDMLNTRIKHELKNNVAIYIPNEINEMYSLLYNIIIQKPNPENSKHIPRVQKLLKNSKMEKLDFTNIIYAKELLNIFMTKNEYKFIKPQDINVGFIVS